MITHVVLMTFKDRNLETAQKVKEMLLGMEGKIPELKTIEAGVDVVRSERSYDLALVTKFESLEDLQAYGVHPVHVEVLNYIAQVKETTVSVDFES